MENQSQLVSIIVPIYNTGKFLKPCLDSIKKQTYENLEIICVNDGSTDFSESIIDEYLKDKRFIKLNKVNGGLSSARNTGLDYAKGQFVTFIDSDDYVDENFILKMIEAINKYNVGMVVCNCFLDFDGKLKFKKIKNAKYNFENYYANKNLDNTLKVIQCNKLFKRAIFESIKFPLGKYHEDGFVICDELKAAKKIYCISDCLYYYRQHSNSILHKPNLQERYDCMESLLYRMNYYVDNLKSFNFIANIYINLLLGNFLFPFGFDNKVLDKYYGLMCDQIRKLKRISFKYKLFCKNIDKYKIYRKKNIRLKTKIYSILHFCVKKLI